MQRLEAVATYRGPLACDTETDSKQWWKAEVGVVSFAWGVREDESVATRNVAQAQSLLQQRMDSGLPIVFHNSGFDLHVLQRRGLRINWSCVHDTLLLARLSDNLGDARLGALGESVLGIPTHKDAVKEWIRQHSTKKSGWPEAHGGRKPHYLDVPDEVLLPYAVQDARLTVMLYEPLYARVNRTLYERERELRRIMFEAESEGVEIDPNLTEQRKEWALREAAVLEQKLVALHGSPINLNSDPQMRKWLYEDLGLVPVSFTPKSQPQINEFSLASNPHPVTRLFHTYNKRVKSAEFFESYLELMDEKSHVHPTINTMAARTHRFSCSDPNLQQVPVRDDRFGTRGVFTSNQGWFVGADYDKQELRIGAEEASDLALLQALGGGTDVYREMAAAMLAKPVSTVTNSERQAAKVAVLSIIYGAGAAKVAESFTVNTGHVYSIEHAKVIRDNFKKAYAALANLMDRMQQMARSRGYVENRWGRVLRVDPARSYVATDYLVQSSGRDVLADAILATAPLIKPYGGRVVMPIHDELVFWFPEEPSGGVLAGISEAMTNRRFSIPLTVNPKRGRTFADIK